MCGQGDACCPVQPKHNAQKTILSLKFESQNELQDTERIQRIWYNTAATTTPSQSPSSVKLERVDHRLKNLQPRFGQQLKFGCRHYQRVGGTPTEAVVQVDKSSIHPPSCLMKDDWNLGQDPADGTTRVCMSAHGLGSYLRRYLCHSTCS